MKVKKIIAWVSSLVVIIGLCVLLSFTFFALNEVQIDFRTSKTNITASNEEIIEASGIQKGGTIFFRNKDEYAKNIEDEYAYIDVINIETVFPSKLIIHLAERQEVYAVKGDDYVYVCDGDLRVLRTEYLDQFENNQSNAMLLDCGISLKNVKVGEYLDQKLNPGLYQALFENNRTLAAQKELIKEVVIKTEQDDALQSEIKVLEISLYSGQTVKIANYHIALSYKTHLMMEVFSNLFEMVGKESLQADGSKVVLTNENLKNCEIYINNFYTQGENLDLEQENCYFKIFVAESV